MRFDLMLVFKGLFFKRTAKIIINKLHYKCYSLFPNTIYALSSGQGRCGVAVIRVSGSNSKDAIKKIAKLSVLPEPRKALLRSLRDPLTNEILDRGLVLWFPGPHSFTGEDSCEFHVHGGPAVITAVLNALNKIPETRPADPGEFTRRAFYLGKLDLVEIEGLADLLQAETEAQRRQALLQSEGVLSKLYLSWRQLILNNLAHLEAHIDFEEDENLDKDIFNDVLLNVKQLSTEIQKHLSDGRKGERLRNGARTVILGQPNVGKSSLLNSLSQRPAAIVTPTAGTTRDILETVLDIGGYPLVLVDTAGLRPDTKDAIEEEGIRRAIAYARHADFIILMVDATEYVEWKTGHVTENFNDYLCFYVNKIGLDDVFSKDVLKLFSSSLGSEINYNGVSYMIVINKIDLITDTDRQGISNTTKFTVMLSCKTEEGFTELTDKMTSHLKLICGIPSRESPLISQVRQHQQLEACLKCLHKFIEKTSEHDSEINSDIDVVLAAEYLRRAMRYIGKICGHVTTEQLLDVIFKDFCIGK